MVEVINVALSEQPVVGQSFSFCFSQTRREHQQWTENRQHEKDHKADDLHLERQQALTAVKDSTGNQTGKHGTLSEQNRSKGVGASAQESKASATIGMSRDKVEINSGDLPQKAKPDEEPHIPSQEDELQDRDADEHVP